MTDFRHSQHADDWDGYTERRAPPTLPPGDPNAPVTREYLDAALKINRHSTREFVAGQIGELKLMIQDGFPDGDTRGHREAHEGVIRRAAERDALWKSLREKVVSGAVIAALISLGKLLWDNFLTTVHTAGPK